MVARWDDPAGFARELSQYLAHCCAGSRGETAALTFVDDEKATASPWAGFFYFVNNVLQSVVADVGDEGVTSDEYGAAYYSE